MKRLVICAVALLSAAAWPRDLSLNLDFEDALRGWSASGGAFSSQPQLVETLERDTIVVPSELTALGGDYWRGVRYPLGASGRHVLRSSDAGQGTLVSNEFTVKSDARYFTVLVGGAHDLAHERVELQARLTSADSATHDRDFDVVARFTGLGIDRLRQESAEIPPFARGRPMRITITDASSARGGHIVVDGMRFSSTVTTPPPAPLWGFADVHTHPMNYMAFGALQKSPIRAVWGVPGQSFATYVHQPSLISRDIPACVPGHGGGPTSEFFINTAEGRFWPEALGDVTHLRLSRATFRGDQLSHAHNGGSGFDDFPSFKMGMHYQMHITQIHRAWEAGLRLMVAIAVDNKGVEFFMSKPPIKLVPEAEVLEAQICGIRQLVELNSDWMEIAYGPADVRRIVGRNHLAVVLGIEMDQLGQIVNSTVREGQVSPSAFDKEIDYLWGLGIRQVTPIHAIDNLLGGAAVFQPAYNYLNDFLNRGKSIIRENDLQYYPPRFFDVREGGCETGPLAGQLGQCVTYRMAPQQIRPALVRSPATLFRRAPFLVPTEVPKYANVSGMMNVRGLSREGREYIEKLMRRGMIVGIEHMSQQSVDDFYSVIAGQLNARGHQECARFGLDSVPAGCYDGAYPVFMSHGSLRALSVADRSKTTIEDLRPSEYELSDRDAVVVGRSGGMLGQFVTESPVIAPGGLLPKGFENDCGGSSKSFAVSLLYAMKMVGDTHVALATDFTIIPGESPRFGADACHTYKTAYHARLERERMPEQYATKAQKNGVVYEYYSKRAPPDDVRLGDNKPLTAYVMDKRRRPFDVNVDGFAHYGLLPDILQDVSNDGVSKATLDHLFSSAESYVQMWEKIGRVMSVEYSTPFTPLGLKCDVTCRGLCPKDRNAGAPH